MEGIPNERLEGCSHGFVVNRLLKLVEKQENGKVCAFRAGHEVCYECYWIFPLVAAITRQYKAREGLPQGVRAFTTSLPAATPPERESYNHRKSGEALVREPPTD